MGNIFDRLAAGPGGSGNSGQGDFDNWNEMVGAAPPEHFGQAVTHAFSQVDPQEYYNHIQPGVGGTDPLGGLAQPQRAGLAQSLLSHLTGGGVDPNQISRGAGVGSLDPSNMSSQDLAGLLQYAQRNNPQALGQVATQYQNEPNILQSLLGNKALMMAAGAIGAKLLSDQTNKRRQG